MQPSQPEPSKLEPGSDDLPRECYALINAPIVKRKRFPEGVVTVVANEAAARAGASLANNIVPALVFGPSRSSEGFRLFYLVHWLE